MSPLSPLSEGLKVQEMGGNAAIGYQQAFDLEGESGIVVRGIATAVRISKVASPNAQNALPSPHRYSDILVNEA